jgi:hypothetical protein
LMRAEIMEERLSWIFAALKGPLIVATQSPMIQ